MGMRHPRSEKARGALGENGRNGQRWGKNKEGAASWSEISEEGVAENVRCSIDILKEGTVRFLGNVMRKALLFLILYIELKFTEVNWLV